MDTYIYICAEVGLQVCGFVLLRSRNPVIRLLKADSDAPLSHFCWLRLSVSMPASIYICRLLKAEGFSLADSWFLMPLIQKAEGFGLQLIADSYGLSSEIWNLMALPLKAEGSSSGIWNLMAFAPNAHGFSSESWKLQAEWSSGWGALAPHPASSIYIYICIHVGMCGCTYVYILVDYVVTGQRQHPRIRACLFRFAAGCETCANCMIE